MIGHIVDMVHIVDVPANIDAAYAAEVDWSHGYRLNPDARLALVGASRISKAANGLLSAGNADRDRVAVVLGGDFGSLSSYESFFDGLIRKAAQPLPYTHALPSTPTAALSIFFELHGPTLTVSGEAEVGVTAVRVAQMLLAAGRCDKVIVGCWHTPSATTAKAGLPETAQLMLLLLDHVRNESRDSLRPGDLAAWSGGRNGRTCVDVLSEWFAVNANQFETPMLMAS
jgi:3-oxoacyl-(acyl-carrier-protein) synthase